jgi:hypothetical protein
MKKCISLGEESLTILNDIYKDKKKRKCFVVVELKKIAVISFQ